MFESIDGLNIVVSIDLDQRVKNVALYLFVVKLSMEKLVWLLLKLTGEERHILLEVISHILLCLNPIPINES